MGNITFGSFIAEKRKAHKFNLRDTAKHLNIAYGYLCDIEQSRRPAPNGDFVERISAFLNLDKSEHELLLDLAAKSRNTVSADLPDYIMEKDIVRAALRVAKEVDATDEEWQTFMKMLKERSRKDFEKYQQEDRHSRYLQEHEKSRSIFPASHVGDRDGTEEGYQDTDLFVDESVDTAEQAIQNLLLEDLHQALLKLSPAERDFILSYYEMKIPNATCLAQRYGITRQAADKRLKKIEEKIKKLVAIF